MRIQLPLANVRPDTGTKPTRKWRRKRLISLISDSEMARDRGERRGLCHPFTGARRTPPASSPSTEHQDPRAPSLKGNLAGDEQAARREFRCGLDPECKAKAARRSQPPDSPCYWNSFRISCEFWLAIDSDWMPSCSCVCRACSWVDAVFISASTMPETPSE
jgi:hypothetical protein